VGCSAVPSCLKLGGRASSLLSDLILFLSRFLSVRSRVPSLICPRSAWNCAWNTAEVRLKISARVVQFGQRVDGWSRFGEVVERELYHFVCMAAPGMCESSTYPWAIGGLLACFARQIGSGVAGRIPESYSPNSTLASRICSLWPVHLLPSCSVFAVDYCRFGRSISLIWPPVTDILFGYLERCFS
jgi:hypothetical protein